MIRNKGIYATLAVGIADWVTSEDEEGSLLVWAVESLDPVMAAR